jgi:hypothetical protein
MPVETPSLFAQVIQEHLALKERNAALEQELPLERYRNEDPFENHPLFKTEEQARLEETMDGEVTAAELEETSLGWPAPPPEEPAVGEDTDSGLWSRSRDFDWGD